MVNIQQQDHGVAVDVDQLQQDAQRILQLLEYPDFDVGILLATNDTIQQYNKTNRGKDKPTDILSFPFYPDLKAGERIDAQSEDEKNLGDIIIAPQFVKDDLERWGQTFDERMRTLLVHGVCHLLGYDHLLDEDYQVMQKKEQWLLDELKK